VREDEDRFDVGGPFVHGKRDERHFGLRWGVPGDDGAFAVFRAVKLRFSDVNPSALRQAVSTGRRLVGSLGLTDEQGWPRCASVGPPVVTWSAAEA